MVTKAFLAAAALSVAPAFSRAAVLEDRAKADPCAKIAGKPYVQPADALACLRAFPINETIKSNVLATVSGALDFFTFEAYQIHSPAPFQESSVNLRAELARIAKTKYASDYDFNKDLHDVVLALNDGHTLWIPSCYRSAFQNILPAPIVSLEKNGVQNVYIAPDAVEFINLLGTNYTSYYDSIKFDWKKYAGAKVLQIDGQDAYAYVDHIASTVSGNYLDHGIRVNSVFTSYRVSGNSWSQRLGDLAGPVFPTLENLKFKLIRANSTKVETVTFPYRASYLGKPFTDKASYWANNCVATADTNGIDYTAGGAKLDAGLLKQREARIKYKSAGLVEIGAASAVGLPDPYLPTAPLVAGKGVLKAYVLPGNKTGVLMVGSFSPTVAPTSYAGFQQDTIDALAYFKKTGVKKLIIDLSNNGGGYVCLGEYLHLALVGSDFGYGGFQTSARANPLARKIVASNVARGVNGSYAFYGSDGYAFLNGTRQPAKYDWMKPPVDEFINNVHEPTSQHNLDICEPFDVPLPKTPYFSASNIVIVGNGNCASTCAQFTTLMHERHNTKMVVFGAKPGEKVEYKGMAGNQVLEWADLDSEIKTAHVKNDTLAPPDLLVNGNIRVNWRTAYSWKNLKQPIAFRSDPAQYRFPYTADIVSNPQKLWAFVEKKFF